MQCINFFIYHRYKLPRYILPLRLGYVGSRDYHSDFLNVVFPQFPNCFLPFPLVFTNLSSSVSTVSVGVFPVYLSVSS